VGLLGCGVDDESVETRRSRIASESRASINGAVLDGDAGIPHKVEIAHFDDEAETGPGTRNTPFSPRCIAARSHVVRRSECHPA
jgi:hypothetical protein